MLTIENNSKINGTWACSCLTGLMRAEPSRSVALAMLQRTHVLLTLLLLLRREDGAGDLSP